MKYYILSTTGFIRNKKGTLHCEQYTHFTRSLNSFLYSFQRVFLVPRKRLRNEAGGQFLSEGKAIQPHLGQTFYPLLIIFVSYLLLYLCPLFSNHLFLNLIFSSKYFTNKTLSGATQRTFFSSST